MINIRTIQHYMYCPRRFGLLEIENAWAENVSVVLANIMHENVHSGNKDGVPIDGLDGKYTVRLVEYKPTQPKDGSIRETDAIQVFAQKLCADYIWKCNSEGCIYYADTRKRVKLPFDEEYDRYKVLLDDLVGKMQNVMESGVIPPKIKGQKCSGCSIKDLCMPKTKKYSIKQLIEEDCV